MKTTILISSDPDFNKLIAEIYGDDQFIALISQEHGISKLVVEFPKADVPNALRAVDLQWFLDALHAAKAKLIAGIH